MSANILNDPAFVERPIPSPPASIADVCSLRVFPMQQPRCQARALSFPTTLCRSRFRSELVLLGIPCHISYSVPIFFEALSYTQLAGFHILYPVEK